MEYQMTLILLAFAIGIIAGLRSMMAPTVVSWAARLGWLNLSNSWLAFLGYAWTPWIFSLAMIGELINDKLPRTPSRKVPAQFITRIITGTISGGALGAPSGRSITGMVAGALGAVAGTLGGSEARARLVKATGGKDLPIALIEDAVAIIGALAIARCIA
jgi:uncharacterized membrane protein